MLLQILQIVWINILLSGDNAVVIALACRDLQDRQRRLAIFFGAGIAVLLRVGLTFFVLQLLAIPFAKLFSGLLLLWVATDLLRQRETKTVQTAGSIGKAVWTIVLADAVMSLDNVVAVAAAARNSFGLIVFGIALSVPLIVLGSALVLRLLRQFPVLIVAGAVMLGWVAGQMIGGDPQVADLVPIDSSEMLVTWAGLAGALVIALVAAIYWLMRRRARSARHPSPAS